MELEHVREFLLLAQTLSYSEAAEQLFIAQSTLTRHVQALERELGGALFLRTPRRIALSAFGERFLPYAAQLVRTEDAMRQTFAASRTGRERVVFDYGINVSRHARAMLQTFREAHPGVELVLWHSGECVEALRSGRCSFVAATEGQLPPGEFCEAAWGVSRLAAAVPQGHPLAGRKSVTLQELAPWQLVIHHSKTGVGSPFMAAWRAAGIQPKLLITKTDVPLTNYVVVNRDIAIVNARTLHKSAAPVCRVAIEPPIQLRDLVAYRRSPALTDAEQLFLRFLVTHEKADWEEREEETALQI